MVELSIPAYICEISDEERNRLEFLFIKFNHARRRAYALLQRGLTREEIKRKLQEEEGINSRYADDTILLVKALPPHVTFGGKRNQQLLMKGKIGRGKWGELRNSIVYSRGDASKKGNLNMRLVKTNGEWHLRVNIPTRMPEVRRQWIYPKLFIPKKYLERYEHLLDGKHPYSVLIHKKDGRYFVYIQVDVPTEVERGKRVLAVDINASHLDFAILDKQSQKLIAVGKVHMYETLNKRSKERERLIHKAVSKLANIARHFNADVIFGKLRTAKFKSFFKNANRKVHQMPQYKMRAVMRYKLPLKGIHAVERSEAGTSKIGKPLSKLLGIDIHKASAIAFAIKVLDCELFTLTLHEARRYEADGLRLNAGVMKRGGLTAPHQHKLVCNEAPGRGHPSTPGRGGLSILLDRLKPNLAGHIIHVKVC